MQRARMRMRSGKRNGGENLEKILHYDDSRLAHSAAALSSATQEGKEAPDRPDRKGSKTGFHISGVSEMYYAAVDLQFKRGRRLGLPTPMELGMCITTDDWKEMVDRWEQLRQKNQERLKHSRLKRRRFLRRAKGKWDYKWQRKKLRIRRRRDDWE